MSNNKINNKIIDNNDKNILVNTFCSCGEYFVNSNVLVIIMPCCHIMHEECYYDYLKNKNINFMENDNHLECTFCKNKVTHVMHEFMLSHDFAKKKYKQLIIDIESVKMNQEETSISITNLPVSIIKFTSIMNKLLGAKTKNDLISTIDSIISCCNIKLNIIDNTSKNKIRITKDNHIEWIDKKINNSKMAIIANHSSYLDSILIYYLFRCGFLASDFILGSDLGRIVASKLKLLIFKRNVDKNVVEKMKEYINKDVNRIAIFPEGTVGNNTTLIRFRTGAFHLGVPILPVVIKFKKMIYDDDFKTCILKILTQDSIEIDVHVSDLIYPPFNEDKIEKIREFMGKVGKLKLSRATNRFLKD
jgi:1-acyl-sn-glycerol-3-phosphate acyltransferase